MIQIVFFLKQLEIWLLPKLEKNETPTKKTPFLVGCGQGIWALRLWESIFI
jgi:hypothetical protein